MCWYFLKTTNVIGPYQKEKLMGEPKVDKSKSQSDMIFKIGNWPNVCGKSVLGSTLEDRGILLETKGGKTWDR